MEQKKKNQNKTKTVNFHILSHLYSYTHTFCQLFLSAVQEITPFGTGQYTWHSHNLLHNFATIKMLGSLRRAVNGSRKSCNYDWVWKQVLTTWLWIANDQKSFHDFPVPVIKSDFRSTKTFCSNPLPFTRSTYQVCNIVVTNMFLGSSFVCRIEWNRSQNYNSNH